jgi:hypothetical protein
MSSGGGDDVESVLYNAHWREHLLGDCAVTGESHVLGVNIELSPPESGARTARGANNRRRFPLHFINSSTNLFCISRYH